MSAESESLVIQQLNEQVEILRRQIDDLQNLYNIQTGQIDANRQLAVAQAVAATEQACIEWRTRAETAEAKLDRIRQALTS